MNIFELFGTIAVENGDANKKISETGEKVRAFASTMKSSLTTAAKWGAGIAAAATAATAVILNKIKNIVSDTAEYADTVDKMSQNMGLSTKAYQEWEYVMNLCGLTMDDLQGGMATLLDRMREVDEGSDTAIRNFGKLGISCYDLNGNMKDAETIFKEVIYALADMENETERTQLAMELFSGAGEKIAPVLNAGADGIQEMIDRAHELGIVLDEEAIAAGVKYTDSVYSLERAWDSVKNKLSLVVMPYLTDFLDKLTNKIPDIKKKIEEWTPAIENTVGKLIEGLEWLIENPEVITEKIKGIYNGFLDVCAAVKYMRDGFAEIWGYVQEIINFLSPSSGNDAVAELAKNKYGTNPEKPPLQEYTPGNAVGASTSAAASIFAATEEATGSAEAIEESLTGAAEALEVAAETLSETKVIPDMAANAEKGLQEDLNDMDLTVSVTPVLSGRGYTFSGNSGARRNGASYAFADSVFSSGLLDHLPGHAEGLDYVPYDNYVARLHKGEKVLTANEASAFRSGEGNTRVEAAVNRLGEILNQVLSAIREGQVIQLETGALVGATAGAMNDRLGALAIRSGRRN